MSTPRGRLLALGAFFVVGLVVAACGSGVPGNSVADVAGNPITIRAFDHWLYVAAKSQAAQSPGAPVIVPNDPPNFTHCVAQVRAQIPSLAKTPDKTVRSDCKQLFTQLSSEVMDFLIKAYWFQAEAARDHIKVTDAEVMNAFDKAKKQQFPSKADFTRFLTQTGFTLQDILFRFRINTVEMKLLKKLTPKVTQKQIAAYYRSHLTRFGTPETRDIRIVLTKTKSQSLAARAALQHGQSWKTVAKKYSTDPMTKNNGGLLVGVAKGQQDQALDNAAFAAPINKLLGPVKGAFGYYVFEVVKITKAKQKTLAESTAAITATLKQQNQLTSQKTLDNTIRKHWLSQTVCRPLYSMMDCSGYKPPKPTTPTTPTAPPTGTGSTGPSAPPTSTTSTTSTR